MNASLPSRQAARAGWRERRRPAPVGGAGDRPAAGRPPRPTPRRRPTLRRLAPLGLAALAACAAAFAQRPYPPAVYRPAADGVITIEAAAYHDALGRDIHAWMYVRVPDGKGGIPAMAALPDEDATYTPDRRADAPRLGYRVAFDRPGRYYVWVRAFARDAGSDSVYVGLDGDAEHAGTVTMYAYGASSWTDPSPGLGGAVLDVASAGTHTVDVWMREDGIYLEALALSTDPAYLPPLSPGAVLWHADHETGDLSQWERPDLGVDMTCGGEYDNGGARAEVTSELAHSGTHAAELILGDVDGNQGTRLMRGRCENIAYQRGLYYSAWYYFPTHFHTPDDWWNVWQWKSKGDGDAHSQVTWAMDLLDDGNGTMSLRLRDKTVVHEGGEASYYPAATLPVPVRQWVHIEAFYLPSARPDGKVIIWQDGREIYDVTGVQTIRPGGDTRWSVNNYTSAIEPDPAVIYVDDASISLERMGGRVPWSR